MSDNFADRHIGTSRAEQGKMLAALGYTSVEELLLTAIPESITISETLDLSAPLNEAEPNAS